MAQAATEGNKTLHGDPLTKGKGSRKVKIDGHSAWRATPTDFHTCTKGPPAHVGGFVKGESKKVFIDGFPAVRVGDKVTEIAGGDNIIVKGNEKVIIK